VLVRFAVPALLCERGLRREARARIEQAVAKLKRFKQDCEEDSTGIGNG
jgi:hypothetical protein